MLLPFATVDGDSKGQDMQFDGSDILFLVVVLWLAIAIINSGGGGGRRTPVPVR